MASRFYNEKNVLLFDLIVLIFSGICLILYGVWNKRAGFPSNCETVLDLGRYILSDTIRLDREGNAWTRKSIEKTLCFIVANELGVKPEDIDLSTKIDDLY